MTDFLNVSQGGGYLNFSNPSGKISLIPYLTYNNASFKVSDIEGTIRTANPGFNFTNRFTDKSTGYKWDISTGVKARGLQVIGFKIIERSAPDISIDFGDIESLGYSVASNGTDIVISRAFTSFSGNTTVIVRNVSDIVLDPTITITNVTTGCNGDLNIYSTITIQAGGTLNICQRTNTTGTGLLNYTNWTSESGTIANFTVEAGGSVNGTAAGLRGGANRTGGGGIISYQGENMLTLGLAVKSGNRTGGGGGTGVGGCGGGGGANGGEGGRSIDCDNGITGGNSSTNTSLLKNADGSYNITIGGGGGGSATPGGWGGALLILNASWVGIYGNISLNGQDTNQSGKAGDSPELLNTGGGGAGGALIVDTRDLHIGATANITAMGGGANKGVGNEGGSGSGGVLKFSYTTLDLNGTANYNVSMNYYGARNGPGGRGVAYWNQTGWAFRVYSAASGVDKTSPIVGDTVNFSVNWTCNNCLLNYGNFSINSSGSFVNDTVKFLWNSTNGTTQNFTINGTPQGPLQNAGINDSAYYNITSTFTATVSNTTLIAYYNSTNSTADGSVMRWNMTGLNFSSAPPTFATTGKGINLSQANYTNMQTSNNDYANVSSTSGLTNPEPFIRMDAHILENPASIEWMKVTIEFNTNGGANEDGQFFIANYSDATYYQVAGGDTNSNPIPTDEERTINISAADVSELISSQGIFSMVVIGLNLDGAEAVRVDVANVTVAYNNNDGTAATAFAAANFSINATNIGEVPITQIKKLEINLTHRSNVTLPETGIFELYNRTSAIFDRNTTFPFTTQENQSNITLFAGSTNISDYVNSSGHAILRYRNLGAPQVNFSLMVDNINSTAYPIWRNVSRPYTVQAGDSGKTISGLFSAVDMNLNYNQTNLINITISSAVGQANTTEFVPINWNGTANCWDTRTGNCSASGTVIIGNFPSQFQEDVTSNDTGISQMNASDNLRYVVAGSALNNPFVRNNFTIPKYDKIFWMEVDSEMGNTLGLGMKRIALWNYTSSVWTEVARGDVATGDFNLTFNISGSNITAYLGGFNGTTNRTIQVLSYVNFAGTETLLLDKVRLVTAFDVINATENAGAQALVKQSNESLILKESVNYNVALDRRLGEPLTLRESIVRNTADDLRVSDTLTERDASSRSMTDDVRVSDTLSERDAVNYTVVVVQTYPRQENETITLTESASNSKGYDRRVSEVLTERDAVSFNIAREKAVSDKLTLKEAASETDVTERRVSDVLTEKDSVVRTISDEVAASDVLTERDAVNYTVAVGLKSYTFQQNETLVLKESVSTNLARGKAVSDKMVLVESTSFNKNLDRPVSDVLVLRDSADDSENYDRRVAEAMRLAEAVTANPSVLRGVSETLRLTDGVNYTVSTAQNFNYTIQINLTMVLGEAVQGQGFAFSPSFPPAQEVCANVIEIKTQVTDKKVGYICVLSDGSIKLIYIGSETNAR